MNNMPQASISLERAAAQIGISMEELERFCQQDTGQRFHHRTIYSGRIRFRDRDILRIRKQLSIKTNIS